MFIILNTHSIEEKMITMTEIAMMMGISQATVSRVLNGNKSVNLEVRKRVLVCAKEHNY